MKEIIKIKQKERLLRLFVLSQSFHLYTKFYLKTTKLEDKKNYDEAEKTSDFINSFFPDAKSTPSDFMYNMNVVSDEIIDDYQILSKWLIDYEPIKLYKSEILAFCKAIEHGDRCFILKRCFFSSEHIIAIFDYINNEASKDVLLENLCDYSIFTKKQKPPDGLKLRKLFNRMEKLYFEISDKQKARKKKM